MRVPLIFAFAMMAATPCLAQQQIPSEFAAAAAVQSPGCRIGYSARDHIVIATCDDQQKANAAHVLLRAAAHGRQVFAPICTYRVPLTSPPVVISCVVTVE